MTNTEHAIKERQLAISLNILDWFKRKTRSNLSMGGQFENKLQSVRNGKHVVDLRQIIIHFLPP